MLWIPILILAVTGCKPAATPAPPPPVVQLHQIVPTNILRSAEFIGQLDSPQNVEIRARVEAFVQEVLFREGTNVVEGQPLFRLDPQPFQEQLAAAEGMLAEAQAALNKYKADVARLEPLAKQKAIPLQDLDNAVASVAVGQANVASAEARVKSARINLGYCEVKAPVAGMIGARQVSVGSLVGKGEPTLLATISQLNPIWFYCALSEVDYLHTEKVARAAGRTVGELPVTLILADGSEHPEPGKWVFLDRAVDSTTGTIRARAEFSNPDDLLRPGMFARIRISLREQQEGILLPERAVLELQGKSFVWVVDGDHRATQRMVQVAPVRIAGKTVIAGGLKPGETVVVEGVHKLREGIVVQPAPLNQGADKGGSKESGSPGQPAGRRTT